jgi:hypothetical protein
LIESWAVELTVGSDLRHRLDPARWHFSAPRADSRDRLILTFDRPLDHGLLRNTITPPVPGRARIGPGERWWSFVPDEPWPLGEHNMTVNTILEDVAGNSLRRAFDRDLNDSRDEPLDATFLRLSFRVL